MINKAGKSQSGFHEPCPTGETSAAADRNSSAEQPPGAHVSAQLHHALHGLGLHAAALQNVLHGEA